MEKEIIRAHIFIEGRVQGVFFRVWTHKKASELALKGWVRNLSDGRVEAVFEGPKEKVEEMVEKCREGPRVAGVKHIDINWEKATGEFKKFEIMS